MPGTDPLGGLAGRALALVGAQSRVMVALTGPPGAGKTTLAEALVERVNELAGLRGEPGNFAISLPMDGFHLANRTLDRLDRGQRKGAIDTFDGWGFVWLLRRLREEHSHTVYAPGFDREIDEGVTGSIGIEPLTRLVIVEGNYLLAEAQPWHQIRELVAQVWFCAAPEAERMRRLVERHENGGRTPAAARAWAQEVDGANAALITSTRHRADVIVSGIDGSILAE
ncbi:MAG: nucleoside/nucleotide kinase family protein [Arachnia sp.]